MSDDPAPVATAQDLAPAHSTRKRRHGPMALGLSQQHAVPSSTVLSSDVPLIDFGGLSHE